MAIIGMALAVKGIGMIYPPAAYIALGVLLVTLAVGLQANKS